MPALTLLRDNWLLIAIVTVSTAVIFDGLVLLLFHGAKRLRHGPTHEHPGRDSGVVDQSNHIGANNL